MSVKYIFDTCAIMDYLKFYSKHNKDIYDYLINMVASERILIIDKVVGELKSKRFKKFKDSIKYKIIETNFLRNKIESYFSKDRIFINEKFDSKNKDYDIERKKFKDEYADLYLIELAIHLKNITSLIKEEVYVVTNESNYEGNNTNLFMKIPTICKQKKLNCIDMSNFLFNHEGFKITK